MRLRLIRITDEDVAELYCYGCREWWPLTLEFWPGRRDFWRCRACERERKRLYSIRRLIDPLGRIQNINKSRRYRAYLKNEAPELLPADEAFAREYDAATHRKRRYATDEERTAATRAYKAAWMRQKRAKAKAA